MTTQLSLTQNTVLSPVSGAKIARILANISTFLNSDFSGGTTSSHGSSSVTSSQFKRNFKKNKMFFIPVVIVVVLLLVGVVSLVRGKSTNAVTAIAGASDNRVELKPAIKSQDLNKTFSFPLKNAAGKEVSKIRYTLEKAELRDEIIVKGQKATSVKGRSFLIIPVKIQNDYNAPVEISARDYIRLIVGGNSNEKLAPDIHNDPVEVQAISTKQTRVGFPIDDSVEKVVLQVGEIKGDKENITIDLKK